MSSPARPEVSHPIGAGLGSARVSDPAVHPTGGLHDHSVQDLRQNRNVTGRREIGRSREPCDVAATYSILKLAIIIRGGLGRGFDVCNVHTDTRISLGQGLQGELASDWAGVTGLSCGLRLLPTRIHDRFLRQTNA
jgi:hypothetical protein